MNLHESLPTFPFIFSISFADFLRCLFAASLRERFPKKEVLLSKAKRQIEEEFIARSKEDLK